MEPLWSPVVATSRNHPQIDRARKPQKQAKSVAVRCHRLPEKFHSKEGVSGSSPEEGFAKARTAGLFVAAALRFLPSAQTWKVGWKNQFCENARNGAGRRPTPLSRSDSNRAKIAHEEERRHDG
jgi:hypothetical protein